MKRYSIIILCLIFLTGCSSTLTYNHITKDWTAKDYTVQIDKDGLIKAAPNRWFTTSFLGQFFTGLFSTAQSIVPLVTPVVTGK